MPALKPIRVSLTGDGLANMVDHIDTRVRGIKAGLKVLHTQKLPTWRRVYAAMPAEQVRVIPFENASNLVVPIAAIHSDTLKAREMAALLRINPIWVTQVRGEWAGEAEPYRSALEEFMATEALEPDSLDLYRVYNDFLDDVNQYGTGFIKAPWDSIINDIAVPAGDGSGKFDFIPETSYDGPRPEKICFEDFGMSPSEKTIEGADFKYHRRRMLKHEIEDRQYRGLFDKDAVEKILGSPDRSGPSAAQQQAETDSQIMSPNAPSVQEWDIYECWFFYRQGQHKTKIIASFHAGTKTLARATYQFLPDDPFVAARLLNRDGSFYGRGMCEFLGVFQEELSQIHNQRRDAQTVANTKVWRVDPFSKLHDGYKIFPSAMLPAAKDEIEPMSHGEPSPMNIDEERLGLELAERRSGISPAAQAYGSGSFSKRGTYGAMGTLSLMQEGNTRTDLTVGDIRYFHTKLGRLLARQYAALGLDSTERFQRYGKQAPKIVEALRAVLNKKMYLPIIAPTASVNREVEKQSDIMLVGIMSRHYQAVAAFLAQLNSPQMPPPVRDYMSAAVQAMNKLMQTVLKHFDYTDPVTYAPEVPNGQPQASAQVQPAAPQPTSDTGMAIPTGGGGLLGVGDGTPEVQPESSTAIQ